MSVPRFIRWLGELGIADVPLTGGENASLGEMYREPTSQGIRVPNGFAIAAEAYRHFLRMGVLDQTLRTILDGWTQEIWRVSRSVASNCARRGCPEQPLSPRSTV